MTIRSIARAKAKELGVPGLMEHLPPLDDDPEGERPFPLESIHPRWLEHLFSNAPQRLRRVQHVLPPQVIAGLPHPASAPLPGTLARRFLAHLLGRVTPGQGWETILASARHEGALLEQILLRGAPGASSTPLLRRARWLLSHFPTRDASELLPALFLPPLDTDGMPSWEHLPMDPLILVTLAQYPPPTASEKG